MKHESVFMSNPLLILASGRRRSQIPVDCHLIRNLPLKSLAGPQLQTSQTPCVLRMIFSSKVGLKRCSCPWVCKKCKPSKAPSHQVAQSMRQTPSYRAANHRLRPGWFGFARTVAFGKPACAATARSVSHGEPDDCPCRGYIGSVASPVRTSTPFKSSGCSESLQCDCDGQT